MKILRNSTYNRLINSENYNKDLISKHKAANFAYEGLKDRHQKLSDHLAVRNGLLCDANAKLVTLEEDMVKLNKKLIKAQKNDMPHDKKTGKFTKKAAPKKKPAAKKAPVKKKAAVKKNTPAKGRKAK